MNQITEQVLQAVDTIITEKLDMLKFDTTETCTVIGQDSLALNTYRVKYNNITFIAKATDDASYKANDIVSVTIPKGDLNAPDKVIIGKISGQAEAERDWENPLDRMIDYVRLQDIEPLQYTITDKNNNDYLENDYNILIRDITLDSGIWEQFIDVSTLGVFDFIGFKGDIYSYLGMIDENSLPTSDQRYWVEIQLCDAEENSLHKLVGNQVSSLIFTSEDIDGDPYSQPFENNTYQKLWHFPKDEILDPTQIRKIKIKLGIDPDVVIAPPQSGNGDYVYEDEEIKEGDEVVQILQNRLGIYVENIELSFGYDLDNYIDEGIILAIPKESQPLQQGYLNTDSPPDITAWVVREDNNGLLRDDDFTSTPYLDNALTLIENNFVSILPRYVSYNVQDTYNDQRGWFIEGSGNNIQLREHWLEKDAIRRNGSLWSLSKLSDENNGLKALINQIFTEEDYNITDQNVIQQVNDQFSAMEHYVSQIIEDYYPRVENENDTIAIAPRLLTENETEQIIKDFFAAYEKLIDIILKAAKKDYQLRWYQYEFGAIKERTDTVGGGYWVPFGEGIVGPDFNYYLGTKLLGSQYDFSINAETQIKAILCQEGFKTEIISLPEGAEPAEQYQIYYSTNEGQTKIYEKIIKFTNAHFTENALVQNNTNYLTITGRPFLNIYNYNNDLYTAHIDAHYNELTVSFKDETALADMKLIPGKSLVKWSILNPLANQIEGFNAPSIDLAACLKWWNETFGFEYNEFTEEGYNQTKIQDWINDSVTTEDTVIKIDEEFQKELEDLKQVIQALRFSQEMRFVDVDEDETTPPLDYLTELNAKYSEITSAINKVNNQTVDWIRDSIERGLNGVWSILVQLTNLAKLIKSNATSSISYLYVYEDDSESYRSTVTYKPRSKFDSANSQSQVRCSIDNFSIDFTINFSLIGSQGTDYLLTIEPIVPKEEKYKGLAHQIGATYQYEAVLRDTQGTKLTITEYNLQWGWKQKETFKQCYSLKNSSGQLAQKFTDCILHSDTDITYQVAKNYTLNGETKLCYYDTAEENADPIAFIQEQDVIEQTFPEPGEVQLKLIALCQPRYLTKEEEEEYFSLTSPSQDGSENGVIHCLNQNYKPNSHILQAECTVPVVFDGQENASQTRTLIAYYPIGIYDPDIGFESADGVYYLGWNEKNQLETPTRTESPSEPNKYDILNKQTQYNIIASADMTNAKWSLSYASEEPKGIPEGEETSVSYFEISPSRYLRLRTDLPELGLLNSNNKMIVTCTNGEDIIYQSPIQCTINHYAIDVVNDWSGTGVYSDDKNGVILTTQFGAGKKDKDGLFTGVMMGEISYNLGTELENGLFGYKDSEQIFKLTTDGQLRVGFATADSNYINFDAASGQMRINSKQFLLQTTDNNFIIDSSPNTDDSYFIQVKERSGGHSVFSITKDGRVSIQGSMDITGDFTVSGGDVLIQSDTSELIFNDSEGVVVDNLKIKAGGQNRKGLIFIDQAQEEMGYIGYGGTGLATAVNGRTAIVGVEANLWFSQPIFAKYGIDLTTSGGVGSHINPEPGRIMVDSTFRIWNTKLGDGTTILEFNKNSNVVLGYRGDKGVGNTNIYSSQGGTINFAVSGGNASSSTMASISKSTFVLRVPLSYYVSSTNQPQVFGYDATNKRFWFGNDTSELALAAKKVTTNILDVGTLNANTLNVTTLDAGTLDVWTLLVQGYGFDIANINGHKVLAWQKP